MHTSWPAMVAWGANSYSKINKPRQSYKESYMPNGYIDIVKTKNILKGFLHGNKVMTHINNEFVSDIDSLFDFKIAALVNAKK